MRHPVAINFPSRNPFADPNGLTLADLVTRVRSADTLPLTTRQNWAWALKTVARAAGKDPGTIPAHPAYLRKVLGRAAPKAIGIGQASWNNARSLCGKALEWAGLASVPGHYLARFAPAWAELWACLPPECALRHQLGRLFHFASAQNIVPTEISDAVLATFHQALETESIVPDPYEIWRGAAKSWNNAAERIPGWPQQRLTVPSRTRSFSMPWSAFPLTLQADVEAYLRRAAGLDLSDDHFTRAQRPATIEKRRKQLRMFATAIVKSGIAADTLVDLPTILMPDVAARGLQYLLDRNSGTPSVQISNLADFLPTLAARLDMPEAFADASRRQCAMDQRWRQAAYRKRSRPMHQRDDETGARPRPQPASIPKDMSDRTRDPRSRTCRYRSAAPRARRLSDDAAVLQPRSRA
jgi:hypothetical protein